jgi:hypothetical protein
MARTKRPFSTFTLAFLDVMSCGLGAVALLFLILKHDVDNQPQPDEIMQAEVNMLEEEIIEGTVEMVRVRNTIDEVDNILAEAQGRARRIQELIDDMLANIETIESSSTAEEIEELRKEIIELENRKRELENDPGDSFVRAILGEGDRQYLTGLKTGGRNILVLLDASASMLDNTIVNIIRKRNLPDEEQLKSLKWQRSLDTVEWLAARFPLSSQYQVYLFNTEVESALPGTESEWLEVSDREQMDEVMVNMRKYVPHAGTDLEKAFLSISQMSPMPDNLYLITDGLPTKGGKATKGSTVTSAQRASLFRAAVEKLPRGVPVNIILEPLEGDPIAASAFWRLAVATRGAFLAPSKDWP